MKPLVVVMGVSGSGKTTIAQELAKRESVPFADADDFHSEANKAKMHAGIPLTDEDRAPWLQAQDAWLREHHDTGAVLACSALKRAYRHTLRHGNSRLYFVHLHGPRDLLLERMNHRKGHFMPPALLDSQLATLEELQENEPGTVIDIGGSPEELLEAAATAVAAWLERTGS